MNYLETLKNIAKDNKRKKENLILLLILLVILLISVNYIFNSDEKVEETKVDENIREQTNIKTTIEDKISGVLSQISGISEVSIVINYANEGNTSVVYDTKETINEQGVVTSVEKNVAYNENSGEKTAIIQMFSTPKVEGVIVVAKGVESTEIKQKISTALGNLLGIASYKVQVFEK